VDDVEALAAVLSAQFARGACVRLDAPGRDEREDLDVEAVDPPQGVDLVADEGAERGPLLGRPHVGDDQDPHEAAASVSARAVADLSAR
jgi:hypothetical protein